MALSFHLDVDVSLYKCQLPLTFLFGNRRLLYLCYFLSWTDAFHVFDIFEAIHTLDRQHEAIFGGGSAVYGNLLILLLAFDCTYCESAVANVSLHRVDFEHLLSL